MLKIDLPQIAFFFAGALSTFLPLQEPPILTLKRRLQLFHVRGIIETVMKNVNILLWISFCHTVTCFITATM